MITLVYVPSGSWMDCNYREIEVYKDCFPLCEIVIAKYEALRDLKGLDRIRAMPRMISQVAAAIKAAKAKGGKVVVCGRSAGGQLAVMASRIVKPDGLILVSAPLDLRRVPGANVLLPWVVLHNPVTKAAADDGIETLIIHDPDGDQLVPFAAAKSYIAARKHIYTALYRGHGHDMRIVRAAKADIESFLQEVVSDG